MLAAVHRRETMSNSSVHPYNHRLRNVFCVWGIAPNALYIIIFITPILCNEANEKTRRRQKLSNLMACQSQESNTGSFAPNYPQHYFLLDPPKDIILLFTDRILLLVSCFFFLLQTVASWASMGFPLHCLFVSLPNRVLLFGKSLSLSIIIHTANLVSMFRSA